MKTPRKPAGLALLVPLLGSLVGCSYAQDRFRDCRHFNVDLVNAQVSLGPINMIVENEAVTEETFLVPGASRQVVICAERGDRKRFFAMRGAEFVDVANCVVTRDPHELTSTVSQVSWTLQGLVCENW
jgi:hypothetical protein